MNLEKKRLPDYIEVGGELYGVKSDFRYGLMFHRFIRERRKLGEYVVFFEGEAPELTDGVSRALAAFYTCPAPLPRYIGEGEEVVDFAIDAELIFAAFWQQYHIDLFEADLHWHKFIALFRGLQGTKLNEVIGFRSWRAGRADYEATMRQLQSAWRLPTPEPEADPELEAFQAKLKKQT